MSALVIKKVKRAADNYFCDTGCRAMSNRTDVGPRIATHKAEILGWPAGHLCNYCAAEWKAAWERESGEAVPTQLADLSPGATFKKAA